MKTIENTFFTGDRKANFISNIKTATVTNLIVYIIGISIWMLGNKQTVDFQYAIIYLGYNSLFSYSLYFVNAILFDFILYKINLFSDKIIYSYLTCILVSAIASILTVFFIFLSIGFVKDGTIDYILDWLFSVESTEQLQRMLWISLTFSTVFFTLNFIKKNQQKEVTIEKQKVVTLNTQHEALKSQIGPHFLFNSLNVLNGLIAENPENAQDFVEELSSIYRYVLTQKDKDIVTLGDEISFGKTYLQLMQKRFEEGLEYNFEIEEHLLDEKSNNGIVPLSLQILLENCIKHNVISSSIPLKIKVYTENNYLIVENNINKKKNIENRIGTGLNNIIERYKKQSNRQVEIYEDGNNFKIKLPILTENEIIMKEKLQTTELEYYEAKELVKKKKEFYITLFTCMALLPFLYFINHYTSNYNWWKWPAMGFVFSLVAQAINTWGFFNSKSWYEKQIRKELNKNIQLKK